MIRTLAHKLRKYYFEYDFFIRSVIAPGSVLPLLKTTVLCLPAVLIFSSIGFGQEHLPGATESVYTSPQKLQDSVRFYAQHDVPNWYDMFVNIPRDWSRSYSLTFRARNIPAMVGMAVLTAGLVATDDRTWQLSDRLYRNSSLARSASDFFEYLGDGRPQFGLAGAFALYGFAASDARSLRTASQTVEAILACGVVIQVLKHTTGRQSPIVSTKPGGVWDVFPNQIEYHKHVPSYDAYPSGHIATALATVTVVAENYPEWVWVKPVGYTIVALIGVSMANTGIHWYSDYPLGLVLGYSFGMLAAHPEGLEDEKSGKEGSLSFSIAPILSSERTGVGISLSF